MALEHLSAEQKKAATAVLRFLRSGLMAMNVEDRLAAENLANTSGLTVADLVAAHVELTWRNS